MYLSKLAGATSNIIEIFIVDSTSATGAGLTGLTSASSGLIAYFHRDTDTSATAISLVTMTVGTFTSSGFKEIDATHMPGWYQFCPPDAAMAASAKSVSFHLQGAATMVPKPIFIQLTAVNVDDSVRMGMTALPNAAASAVGGLPLSVDTSGRVDVLKINGTSQTARDIGASVLLSPGTGAGQLDITSGVVKANLAQILGTALTETSGQIAAAFKKFFNIATPTSTMNEITLVDTTTAAGTVTGNVNGNVTGSTGSVIGAVGSVTGNVGGNVVGSTGSVTGAVGSVTGSVGSVTGNVGGNVVGSVGSVVATVAANLTQILGTALTETSGQIAAGFKKFFNVGTPTSTMNELTLVDTVTTYTGNTPQTGDSFARLGAPAGASVSADILVVKNDVLARPTNPLLTNDSRLNHIDADISSRLAPTVAGHTLDVTATGAAGIDWANIENPDTIQSLSQTSIGYVGNPVTVGTNNDKSDYTIAAQQIPMKRNVDLPGFQFPMYAPAGGLATGLSVTAEVSLDGADFVSTTNDSSEIGSTGVYTLDFAGADLDGDTVCVKFSATGAVDLVFTELTQ